MYFKISLRYNSAKQHSDASCRLVESYRSAEGRVCHRTILNIGFIEDEYTAEQLNEVAKILTARYEQKQFLFSPTDPVVVKLAESLWQRIIQDKRLDLSLHTPTSRYINADTLRHSNVRVIGAEWIGYQTLEELQLGKALKQAGFSEERLEQGTVELPAGLWKVRTAPA